MLNTLIAQHFKTSPHKKHAANTDAAAQITHSPTPQHTHARQVHWLDQHRHRAVARRARRHRGGVRAGRQERVLSLGPRAKPRLCRVSRRLVVPVVRGDCAGEYFAAALHDCHGNRVAVDHEYCDGPKDDDDSNLFILASADDLQRVLHVCGGRADGAGKSLFLPSDLCIRASLCSCLLKASPSIQIPFLLFNFVAVLCLQFKTLNQECTARQVQVVVAQADLAACIIVIDLVVSIVTTHFFLRSKQKLGVKIDAEQEELEDLMPVADKVEAKQATENAGD